MGAIAVPTVAVEFDFDTDEFCVVVASYGRVAGASSASERVEPRLRWKERHPTRAEADTDADKLRLYLKEKWLPAKGKKKSTDKSAYE